MKPKLYLASVLVLALSIGLIGKGIVNHSGWTVTLAWLAANLSLVSAIHYGRRAA